jgi:hypothetical protein
MMGKSFSLPTTYAPTGFIFDSTGVISRRGLYDDSQLCSQHSIEHIQRWRENVLKDIWMEGPHFGISPGLMLDSNRLMVDASGVQFGAELATLAEKTSDRINNLFMSNSNLTCWPARQS